MTLKQTIDQDLKQAMLAGDKTLTETLRGLKSAILYVEVAANKRDTGLTDDEVTVVMHKEAKKRQESADLYKQGGNQERASSELNEKVAIEKYLPEKISDTELDKFIDESINEIGKDSQKMGQIIGAVKQKTGATADGATIARLVKEKLQ